MKSIIQKLWMVMAMLCLSISASAYGYDIEVDGIYYNIFAASKTAKVTFGEVRYTGEISIPETIVYANHKLVVNGIDEKACKECTDLRSITLPETITSIGADAFQECSSLTDIRLPESVASISSGAFRGCSALRSITLPETITSIGADAFQECSSLTDIKLPESVASIGSGAFRGCSALTTISLPLSVTKINDDTFYGCKKLEMIFLSYGLESIGKRAFYECESLRDLIMPYSINSIGENAFAGCNFDYLRISGGINVITGDSLWGCTQANTLEFQTSLEPLKLGNYTYSSNGQTSSGGVAGCSWKSLRINNLIIRRPIQYLNHYHYFYWGGTNSTYQRDYDFENPLINNQYVESISLSNSFAFKAAADSEYKHKHPYDYSWKWTGDFSIENLPNLKCLNINCENMADISQGCIAHCPNLEKIVISGIRTIEKNCFKDFSSLTYLQLNDVENIKSDVFLGCTSLKEVEFPSSLKALSNSIVSCPLESLTLNSPMPPTSETFPKEVYLKCVLNVPFEYLEAYQSYSPWNNFWNIQGISVPIESLYFDEEMIMLDTNETRMLYPVIYPVNASNKDLEWVSSNPALVRVSENGTISSGMKEGEATITAMACDVSGVSASIKVIVQEGSGISDLSGEATYKVNVDNGAVCVSGKSETEEIEVFNTQGQKIASSFNNTIYLNAKGIHLVKVGSKCTKVIL